MTRKRRSKNEATQIRMLTSTVARNDISRQSEDVDNFGADFKDVILATPYHIPTLSGFVDQSNILPQCIEAMVTNTARFGSRVVPIEDGAEMDEKEKDILKSFISSPNINESMMSVQSAVTEDYERYGFSFYEVIRNARGKPTLLKHAKAFNIRLMRKSGDSIPITVEVFRGGERSKVTERKKFRKYIQVVGVTKTYYKEFGDPRDMDYRTGKYATKADDKGNAGYKVKKDDRATELLHHRQYSEDSYGLPRWISQLPSILGSRESEEVNLRYFEDNTVPPMILSVAGGRLTRQSFQQLNDLLKSKGLGKDRQNQILLIEAIPETTGLDEKGTARIQIDKLTSERPSDGLFKEYDDSNISKVRSSFRLPPVVIGMSQDVNFACYDVETETLTDKGWIKHTEWSPEHKIAVYDKNTAGITYEYPKEGIQRYTVNNVQMYAVSNRNQDMLVTPEHNMLYKSSPKGSYGIKPIEDMVGHGRVKVVSSGILCAGNTLCTFAVPHIKPKGGISSGDEEIGDISADCLLEWLGYYIADGFVCQRDAGIRMGAKKSRKILRFESLHDDLEQYGFRVRISDEPAGTYFNVSHKGMASWMLDNAGTGSINKRIPEFVWDLPAQQLRILFDSMMFCDGAWDRRTNRTSGAYSTVSPKLADDMHRLCVLLGYRATVRVDRPGSFGENNTYRILVSESTESQIYIERSIDRVEYSGIVYCFTVSTGVFITRRNGKVAFQGNTAQTSMYVAETQVFMPERKIHDEFLNKNFFNHPNGLGLKSVMHESRGPSVTNPDQVVKTMTAVNTMGGVTPRSSIEIINETMQLSLPLYPKKDEEGYEEWMDMPIALSIKVMGASQQTGEGEESALSGTKTDEIDKTEAEGETGASSQAVEHGQE